jgi:hypothetical protein
MNHLDEFQVSSIPLYNYPCCVHYKTKELCIFGELGQIYQYSDSLGFCIVYHANGDETGIKFENKDAKKYIKKIKTVPDQQRQIKMYSDYVQAIIDDNKARHSK